MPQELVEIELGTHTSADERRPGNVRRARHDGRASRRDNSICHAGNREGSWLWSISPDGTLRPRQQVHEPFFASARSGNTLVAWIGSTAALIDVDTGSGLRLERAPGQRRSLALSDHAFAVVDYPSPGATRIAVHQR